MIPGDKKAGQAESVADAGVMLDYGALGLKAGLELHQQLDTRYKLFCRCPTVLRDTSDSNGDFFRYLRSMHCIN